MPEYNFAHNDTSSGERATPTSKFNPAVLPEAIQSIRNSAFAQQIPTADDETINFLTTLLSALKPENILELGTAVGISGAVMLNICPQAHLTTVEREPEFVAKAERNFADLGLGGRVRLIEGDAGEVINSLNEKFDFIFLDCAKVQYVKYLPRLKQLLKKGGVLLADDVLLYGWITGEAPVPPKRKMLAQHISEYIAAVTSDSQLSTTVINLGDGLAMSVLK